MRSFGLSGIIAAASAILGFDPKTDSAMIRKSTRPEARYVPSRLAVGTRVEVTGGAHKGRRGVVIAATVGRPERIMIEGRCGKKNLKASWLVPASMVEVSR